MTDLRALLGERYDVVMQAACGCDGTRTPHCYECSDSTWDHECPDPVPCRHRAAESVLARVLPDLLDAAAAEHAMNPPRIRAHSEILDSLAPLVFDLLAEGWDAAVRSMCNEDGTPVEIVVNSNPYRRPTA